MQSTSSIDIAGFPSLNGTKRKHHDTSTPNSGGISSIFQSEDEHVDSQGETLTFSDLDHSVESSVISKSNRRAQNRAAQRAFRERKEKHLRELEDRLTDLENESRGWKSTNMALRTQLSVLEQELQHYRHPWPENAQNLPKQIPKEVSQNMNPQNMNTQNMNTQNMDPQNIDLHDINSHNMALRTQLSILEQELQHYRHPWPENAQKLSKEGPKEISQNMAPHNMAPLNFVYPFSGSNKRPLQQPNQRSMEFGIQEQFALDHLPNIMTPHASSQQQQLQNEQILGQIPPGQLLSSLNSPGSLSNSELSYGVPTPNSSVPMNVDEFCSRLSTACITIDRSGPKIAPQVLSETPGWQQDACFGNVSDQVHNHKWNSGEKRRFGISAQQPAQTSMQQTSILPQPQPQPHNLSAKHPSTPVNLDFGNLATGSGPLNLDGDGLNFDGLLGNEFGVFDPLDDMLEWQPKSHQEQQPAQVSSEQTHFQLAQPDANGGLTEMVPATSQKFIPCADVWDRICAHPRFGEIDINSMCWELHSRALCSRRGVVLDVKDVDEVLSSLR